MLHVFHVDSGCMITLDMNLALESVANLKRVVQDEFNIAADKQVLLISGGECLDPNKRVCSYSAGTDTNPIFLFSKSIIESPTPPLPSLDSGTESDIGQKVREHCDMPVTFATVGKRAQMAQHLAELARKQLTTCENLVHDQHLQQQGWSAVVANLEDITDEFRKRSEIFEKSFQDYIDVRESYIKFLGLEDPDEDENYDKKEDKRESTVVFSISPEQHDEYLNRPPSNSVFNCDLEILQRIPVLPVLLMTNQQTDTENSKTSEGEDEEATNTSQTSETSKEITLFDWIAATDNKSTMDQLYEHCSRGLQQFDKKVFKSLSNDIAEMIENAENGQMKEVKGLGERLSGLETLMREAKKFVKQQAELALSFANNQSRASNTKDASVLPDLCRSHKRQLEMMASNHAQLCDIRRRCAKAKEELSVNLYHRLKWVMYIEDHISETDHKLVIYHENLKRLRRHLEILQQIHLAPATYLCALAEVVRRRTFSQHFLLWASELACHLLTIHNEEVTRRKDFQSQFDGHFLNSLFPGMDDVPPNFATQAPPMFDITLPKITQEDIDRLKKELPDMADKLNVPDTSALTNFFLLRSLTARKEETLDVKIGSEEVIKAVEEKLIQAVNDVGLASDLDRDILRGTGSEPCLTTATGLPHLKDLDRGCESETDTEEFEKVGQSPLELNFEKNIPSPRPRTQDASTSTESPQVNSPLGHQTAQNVVGVGDFSNDEFYIDESLPSSLSIETGLSQGSEFIKQLDTAHNVVALLQDNLQISRSEHNRLKTVLSKLHQLAREATVNLRSELTDLRAQVLGSQNFASQQCDTITSSWQNLIILREQKEKDTLELIIRSHEEAINELKKQEVLKDKQIEDLLNEKVTLESDVLRYRECSNEVQENLDKLKDENLKIMVDVRTQLLEKETEKNRLLKETSDRLIRDHKAEIESIRARFKLMTMERSPSENNLEKSLDINNLPSNSTFLQQMKDNFDMDKEKAVSEAIIKEREKWEKLMEIRTKEIENKYLEEKDLSLQNLAKKITEEKDKQIDVLMEREKNLNLECIKYKSTIQQLAESATESSDVELLKMITNLQNEKEVLMEELESIKGSKEKAVDMAISVAVCEAKVDVTTSPMKQKEEKKSEYTKKGMINVENCKPGDRVMVCWDKEHENFRVIQEKQHLYFLHSDYLEGLGLEVIDGEPNKYYCMGEVVNKEYCYARKSDNRYKVPKCTKFFRVKVRPTILARDITQSLYQPSSSVESLRMTRSQSAVATCSEDDRPASHLFPTSPIPVILEGDQPDGADVVTEQEEDQGDVIVEQSTEICENVVRKEAKWPDEHFAEDSGIVDNVEEAMAALDNTLVMEGQSGSLEKRYRSEDEDLQFVVNKTIEDPFLVV